MSAPLTRAGDAELHVALALRRGQKLTGAQVSAALADLPALAQPTRVRVVPAIPVSTWWRPRRAELAACPTLAAWVRAADGEYRAAPTPALTGDTQGDPGMAENG